MIAMAIKYNKIHTPCASAGQSDDEPVFDV